MGSATGTGRIKADDFLIFNQQFLTLSKSGLAAAEIAGPAGPSNPQRSAARRHMRVRDKVRAGALLSEAFESTGSFPRSIAPRVRAGERSGSLDQVLGQYLTYQKQSRGFRKKFISALIYPAFLCFPGGPDCFCDHFRGPAIRQALCRHGRAIAGHDDFTISFRHAGEALLAAHFRGHRGAGAVDARRLARSGQMRLAWERLKFQLPLVGSSC